MLHPRIPLPFLGTMRGEFVPQGIAENLIQEIGVERSLLYLVDVPLIDEIGSLAKHIVSVLRL
jgi:hypothetical protein